MSIWQLSFEGLNYIKNHPKSSLVSGIIGSRVFRGFLCNEMRVRQIGTGQNLWAIVGGDRGLEGTTFGGVLLHFLLYFWL